MQPREFDHIALRVTNRAALVERLVGELSLHVEREREGRTLLMPSGAGTGRGAGIALVDAPDGTVPAAGRIVSLLLADPGNTGRRPISLEGALAITFGMHDRASADVPVHALLGVTLRSDDPTVAAADYVARFGFEPINVHRDVAAVAAGSGVITLVRESSEPAETPALKHLCLRVDSAREHLRQAEHSGLEVIDVVEAGDSIGVLVCGPERVCLEYLERTALLASV